MTPDAVAVHDAHASGLKLPPAARRRQYIGAVIRMLMDTEPFYNVWLYRTIILVQNLALWASNRPEALRGRDLLAALDGNPGPLPVRPLEPATQLGQPGPERAVSVGVPAFGAVIASHTSGRHPGVVDQAGA